jgi:short-subunit dehydrogenase involved in D-alanine esterification of teichoic acids
MKQTVQEIQRQQPDAHLKEFQVDLASFKSIKKFGSSLKQWVHEKNVEPSIQLLVNNAGILAKSHRITEDGLDEYVLHLIVSQVPTKENCCHQMMLFISI